MRIAPLLSPVLAVQDLEILNPERGWSERRASGHGPRSIEVSPDRMLEIGDQAVSGVGNFESLPHCLRSPLRRYEHRSFRAGLDAVRSEKRDVYLSGVSLELLLVYLDPAMNPLTSRKIACCLRFLEFNFHLHSGGRQEQFCPIEYTYRL